MNLAGKRVLVVGLAQTGIAVARFCASRGAKVTVTDKSPAEKLADRVAQLGGVAELELGGHATESFTGSDLVVMSPGVPEMPEMGAARAAGVEVIAEIELAWRFFHPESHLVAITGTNGKSTTTALTGTLCAAGGTTFCGGNLGNHPLIEAVDHPANKAGGYIVAEVAGFMLETCTSFRPEVGALLNITPDHLDRYGTMEVYASMKTRIWKWQTAGDWAIANANCAWTMAGARQAPSQVLVFDSQRSDVDAGACLSADRADIVLRIPGRPEERYPVAELPIIGTHNLENAMASYLGARLVGVPYAAVRAAAQTYRPLKHRMERIGEKDGVDFYDDSKGTNVDAVAASLKGFPRPVVLIAGGVDKGGSYEPMLRALAGNCRGMVLIGKAAPLIRAAAAAFGVPYPVVDGGDMHDAVRRAAELAGAGDAVVLSPACASYDMFKNFGERGMVFRDAVEKLGARRLDR